MNALAPVNSPKSSPFESSGARLASPDGRLLPLRSAHVDVEARGGIARVILTQRFANPSDAPLNVQYTLPLPADGAVSGFAFTVGERRIVGEVDRKASARDRFEAAVLEGRTAALIEQVRDSAFDQALGNVPPKGEVVCEVVVDQPLRWLEEGRWEWRFPTVVGPRYMGGEGLVPDADALTVDLSPKALKTRMSLTLVIADPDCIAVDSPSHTLSVTGDEVREVRFGGDPSVRLDRDLVVQWAVSAQTPGATLDAARPADGEHGGAAYGLITVTPPTATPPQATKARDLICLIDTSGSMGGLPLDQAKRVVSALIDGLGDDDRVELIEFGSAPRRFKTEPTAATRAGKKAALKWVRSLRASGATNMHTAVLEALHPLRPKAQRQVVLLTDGYIGFEQLIIGQLLRELPTESRLHVVGVGDRKSVV